MQRIMRVAATAVAATTLCLPTAGMAYGSAPSSAMGSVTVTGSDQLPMKVKVKQTRRSTTVVLRKTIKTTPKVQVHYTVQKKKTKATSTQAQAKRTKTKKKTVKVTAKRVVRLPARTVAVAVKLRGMSAAMTVWETQTPKADRGKGGKGKGKNGNGSDDNSDTQRPCDPACGIGPDRPSPPIDAPPPDNLVIPPAPAIDVAYELSQLVQLVNEVRSTGFTCPAEGYQPPVAALTVNDKLMRAAQAHSDDMIANNYFDHSSLNGDGPGERIVREGYSYLTWGENLASGWRTAAGVMSEGWLKSSGHCRNLMRPELTEIGVGIAASGRDVRWTQKFATPGPYGPSNEIGRVGPSPTGS